MIILGLSLGGEISLSSGGGIALLIYLAFLSAIAYALWGLLLKFNPVSRVSIFSFTTPIFGTILSILLLPGTSGTSPVNIAITLVLVSAGIFLLNYSGKKR